MMIILVAQSCYTDEDFLDSCLSQRIKRYPDRNQLDSPGLRKEKKKAMVLKLLSNSCNKMQ